MKYSAKQMPKTGPLFDKGIGKETDLETPPPDWRDEWLLAEDAALYLKLSVGELRNKTSNGLIPHYKFGKRNLYRLVELRDLLLSLPRKGVSYDKEGPKNSNLDGVLLKKTPNY